MDESQTQHLIGENPKLPLKTISKGVQFLLGQNLTSPLLEKNKFKAYNQRISSGLKDALRMEI
mgnify:CR=1 FL=1